MGNHDVDYWESDGTLTTYPQEWIELVGRDVLKWAIEYFWPYTPQQPVSNESFRGFGFVPKSSHVSDRVEFEDLLNKKK